MSELEKAARQALEALESYTPGDYSTGHVIHPSCDEDAWIKAITALRRALADSALDKMAENARELGLDYEPVWDSGPTNKDYEDAMRMKRLSQLTDALEQPVIKQSLTTEQPAQQEPVEYCVDAVAWESFIHEYDRYTSGDPNYPWANIREGLAAVIQSARPQAREPLTDEQIDHAAGLRGSYSASLGEWSFSPHELIEFARAIEAAHGIKGDA